MRSCVFIMGTNCTGKTTIARELIKCNGGVKETTSLCTYTNGNVALAGSYESKSNCSVGVDRLGKTSVLIDAIKEADSRVYEIFIAEGCIIGTFGMNITNALCLAERPIVLFTYAKASTLNERLRERTGSSLTKKVIEKQRSIAKAVTKYKEIGVNVIVVDERYSIEEIIKILKKIINL